MDPWDMAQGFDGPRGTRRKAKSSQKLFDKKPDEACEDCGGSGERDANRCATCRGTGVG